MNSLLQIRNLGVSFPAPCGRVSAVREVSLSINNGEVLGLVGESGSGKSVTALSIMRLLPPVAFIEGEIIFQGQDLLKLPAEQMRQVRGMRIAMIDNRQYEVEDAAGRISQAVSFMADVTDASSVQSVFAEIERRLGHKWLPRYRITATGSVSDPQVIR